jgi:hypothetical protein
MKKLLLAALLAAIVTPAFAAPNYRTWTGASLLQRWVFLNTECRGGLGNNPATYRACDERNLVDAALYAHGYCFVGNVGAETRWEQGPASRWTRRGEQATCH